MYLRIDVEQHQFVVCKVAEVEANYTSEVGHLLRFLKLRAMLGLEKPFHLSDFSEPWTERKNVNKCTRTKAAKGWFPLAT